MLDYISVPHVFIMFLYHFCMIYGTNLLTRCPVPVHFSVVFLFQKSCSGKFLGINRKFTWIIFTKEQVQSQEDAWGGLPAPRRPPSAAHTLAAPRPHLVPSDVVSSCHFAYKFLSTWKPSIPDHILQKTSEAAAATVDNPRSGGFWSSSQHPAGGGIVTGGIYTTMPASRVMCE